MKKKVVIAVGLFAVAGVLAYVLYAKNKKTKSDIAPTPKPTTSAKTESEPLKVEVFQTSGTPVANVVKQEVVQTPIATQKDDIKRQVLSNPVLGIFGFKIES